MNIDARPSRYADVAMLRRSLAQGGRDVILSETPSSTVFLAGESAYKLRKPVRAGFLGRRSETRADASRREVELNAQLAPGIVLGVRAVVPTAAGDHYVLEPADHARAIDHVVEMRRFDGAHTMRALVQRGALTAEQAAATGGRLARFHRSATPHRGGVDYAARVNRNLAALAPLVEPLVGSRERLSLQRFADAFLLTWADVLDARAVAGLVVDGHGDLRPEHVLFEPGAVLMVGRLESDARRVVDVADDLAFLLMELAELTGTDTLGDAVLVGYARAGGARQPDALLAFLGSYRAQQRAKVALLRGSRPGVDGDIAQAHARRLLALSRRLAWRARGPLVLIVTGPPAGQQATLARALGSASGLPVLPSDAIRDERPDSRTSGDEATVHAELARRIRNERAAIAYATVDDAPRQRALAEQLAAGGAPAPLLVDCRAPHLPCEVDERFGRVDGHGDDVYLAVDSAASTEVQVNEVESWLDSLLAAGRGA